jgi:hypothetical protein
MQHTSEVAFLTSSRTSYTNLLILSLMSCFDLETGHCFGDIATLRSVTQLGRDLAYGRECHCECLHCSLASLHLLLDYVLCLSACISD